jgi:hypothetical protein
MSLDRRAFLGLGVAAAALRLLPPGAGPAPHAALHLYTKPLLRPRHAAIVAGALQQRAAAHTSGWENKGGKPVLAIGPVKGHAAHWHGDTLVKDMDRVWPFVAVLEYDGAGKPVAFLDCFRRARGSAANWILDPGTDYANHINKEVVHAQAGSLSLMAVPDTPTGDVIQAQEFCVRARVDWGDGAVVRGWWFWFDAPVAKTAKEWRCVATPLVDWRVVKVTAKAGVVETAPLGNRARELAVWGTDTVFTFPEMPAGLDPGRGRG